MRRTRILAAPTAVLAFVLGMGLGGAALAGDRTPSTSTVDSQQAAADGAGSRAVLVAQDRRRGRSRRHDNHIIGRAHVIEGDVIEIRGRRIKLFGVEAFNRGQRCRNNRGRNYRCGRRARYALARKVEKQRLSCARRAPWRNGVRATCWFGAEDIAAWLVLSGWAVASPEGKGFYDIHERIARRQRVNAWSGEFTRPDRWRERRHDRRRRRRGESRWNE